VDGGSSIGSGSRQGSCTGPRDNQKGCDRSCTRYDGCSGPVYLVSHSVGSGPSDRGCPGPVCLGRCRV